MKALTRFFWKFSLVAVFFAGFSALAEAISSDRAFLSGDWTVTESNCAVGVPRDPFKPGHDMGAFHFNESGTKGDIKVVDDSCEMEVEFDTTIEGDTLRLTNDKIKNERCTRGYGTSRSGPKELVLEIRKLTNGDNALIIKIPPESHGCIPDGEEEIILIKTPMG